jgi:putative transposase
MQLVEKHIIKKSDPLYKELDKMCLLSKNLYNQSLYRVRQYYFENKKYLTYANNVNCLTQEQQVDYISLPRKVSQWVCKQVDQNFKSFFASLKSKNVNHKVRIPKYLNKNGRNILTFTNQAISHKELKDGYLKLSGCENKIKVLHNNIQQVRVIPQANRYMVEIIYSIPDVEYKANTNYVGVDLGLNNLATVGGNTMSSLIVNGKPLKSINQFYNKRLSKLKSRQDLCKNKKVNKKKIQTLTNKRNNKIKDYLHKASRLLVNQLVSNDISTVVIGHNKEWKQDINIGKQNNQKFVQIPFNTFIHMIVYKAQMQGIKVIQREESYTSKCSFIDNEEICKHENYKGKRIKRGLYKSQNGRIINADLNGALNILKKEIPNAFDGYGIEVCSTPVVLTIK